FGGAAGGVRRAGGAPIVNDARRRLLPPEGEAAAEERAAGDVGALAGLRVDELGLVDLADALAHEADGVEVERDAAGEAELEAAAALAADVGVRLAVLRAAVDRVEQRGGAVG